VGFEQVVEELHVQLIVFHDQDGLWHFLPVLSPIRISAR
jgi:hypothetical protein